MGWKRVEMTTYLTCHKHKSQPRKPQRYATGAKRTGSVLSIGNIKKGALRVNEVANSITLSASATYLNMSGSIS
jgi:hypothetical protein